MMNVINYNLLKYNISTKKFNDDIIDDIIFNGKKHIVSVFKDYLILDDSCDFISKYYSLFESLNLLFKISNNNFRNNIPTLSDIEKEYIILKGMRKKFEKINLFKKKSYKKINKGFHFENNLSMLSLDSQKTIELCEKDKIIIGCKDFGDVNDYSLLIQLISNKKQKKTVTHYKNEDKKKISINLMKKFKLLEQNKTNLKNKSPNKINNIKIQKDKVENNNNNKKIITPKFLTIESNNNTINSKETIDKKNNNQTTRKQIIKKKEFKILKTCNTDENKKVKKNFNIIDSDKTMKKNLSYIPLTTKSIKQIQHSKNNKLLSEKIFQEKNNLIKKNPINIKLKNNINSRNKVQKQLLTTKSTSSYINVNISKRKNSISNNRLSKTPNISKPIGLIKKNKSIKKQIKYKNTFSNSNNTKTYNFKKDNNQNIIKSNNLFPKNKELIKKKILNKLKLD